MLFLRFRELESKWEGDHMQNWAMVMKGAVTLLKNYTILFTAFSPVLHELCFYSTKEKVVKRFPLAE